MFGDDICCDSSMFLAEGWVSPAIVDNLERECEGFQGRWYSSLAMVLCGHMALSKGWRVMEELLWAVRE